MKMLREKEKVLSVTRQTSSLAVFCGEFVTYGHYRIGMDGQGGGHPWCGEYSNTGQDVSIGREVNQ